MSYSPVSLGHSMSILGDPALYHLLPMPTFSADAGAVCPICCSITVWWMGVTSETRVFAFPEPSYLPCTEIVESQNHPILTFLSNDIRFPHFTIKVNKRIIKATVKTALHACLHYANCHVCPLFQCDCRSWLNKVMKSKVEWFMTTMGWLMNFCCGYC